MIRNKTNLLLQDARVGHWVLRGFVCLFIVLIFGAGRDVSADVKNLKKKVESSPLQVLSLSGTVCDQAHNVCTASGGVTVTKGPLKLKAEQAFLYFKDLSAPKKELSRIEARGNVVFSGWPGTEVRAPKAVYHVAKMKLSLHEIQGVQPQIIRGNQTLKAPQIHIYAAEKPATVQSRSSGYRLRFAKALGGLLLTTPTEKVEAQEGTYDFGSEKIKVYGDVCLTNAMGQAQGSYGEMDVKTQKIRLLSEVPESEKGKNMPSETVESPTNGNAVSLYLGQ